MEPEARAEAAVLAWTALTAERRCSMPVEVLKQTGSSAVYRLPGAGPAGADVIAKWARRGAAARERHIYVDVLPRLGLTGLGWFGVGGEESDDHCWLFVEEAAGERYSPSCPAHRVLAADWLARLHVATSSISGEIRLPDRGPRRYLRRLRAARGTMLSRLAGAPDPACDRAVLREIAASLHAVEKRWRRVEEACAAAPRTLVHGDLKPSNLLVGSRAGSLLALDWACAGIAPPAIDLAQAGPTDEGFAASPDLAAYRQAVRRVWPGFDGAVIERLAAIGGLFRSVDAIGWELLRLAFISRWRAEGRPEDWLDRPMQNLRYFSGELSVAAVRAGLEP